MAMLVVLVVIFALSLIAITSVNTTDDEMSIAGNVTKRAQAFLAAQAGMARADYVLTQNPDLTDPDSLTAIMNSAAVLPNASFVVSMDSSLPIRRVIALGQSNPGTAGIQVLYKHANNPAHIWNNAMFAGHARIKGNVGVHGSVHVMGDGERFTDSNGDGDWDPGEPFIDANRDGAYDPPLDSTDAAVDLTGSARLSNTYEDMSWTLYSRLPSLSTVNYGGEMVQTLDAELRAKHGHIDLSGSAKVGQPNAPGGSPAYKETFDAVWVNDGFSGADPDEAVYSDNGYNNSYDLEDLGIEMPNLDLPYTAPDGTNYSSYMAYLKTHSLVISGKLEIEYDEDINYMSNQYGSIYMDDYGNLQISGIVYVKGNIEIKDEGRIKYSGRGTLVSENDVIINDDLYSKNQFATNDVLGVIAYRDILIGTKAANLKLSGAYFAQRKIRIVRQSQVTGTLISNYLDMQQVPDIYQVPELLHNLPPGMPGANTVSTYIWRKVPRSWIEL